MNKKEGEKRRRKIKDDGRGGGRKNESKVVNRKQGENEDLSRTKLSRLCQEIKYLL